MCGKYILFLFHIPSTKFVLYLSSVFQHLQLCISLLMVLLLFIQAQYTIISTIHMWFKLLSPNTEHTLNSRVFYLFCSLAHMPTLHLTFTICIIYYYDCFFLCYCRLVFIFFAFFSLSLLLLLLLLVLLFNV